MAKSIVVNFIGDASRLKRATEQSLTGIQKFQRGVSQAGKRLTMFASVPVAAALGKATKAALDERKEVALLEGAIRSATGARRIDSRALESWTKNLQDSTAFVDTDVRNALSRFVHVLKDTEKAQKATAFAADFARAHNITLEEAVTALMGAETGRVGALKKLGVETKNADGSTKNLSEVIRDNEQAVKGAAKEYAEGAGKGEVFKNKMDDLSESLGTVLIPFVDKLVGWMTKLVGWFEKLTPAQKDVIVYAGLAVIALGPLLTIVSNVSRALGGAYKFAHLLTGQLPKLGAASQVSVIGVGALATAAAGVVAAFAGWQVGKWIDQAFQSVMNRKGPYTVTGAPLQTPSVGSLATSHLISQLQKYPNLHGAEAYRAELRRRGVKGYHGGGIVPGAPSQETLAVLRGGERVSASAGSGRVLELHVHIGPREITRIIREDLLRTQRSNVSVGLV